MRAKILSVIAIFFVLLVLMGTALSALPHVSTLSGFYAWFAHIVNLELVMIGVFLSGLFIIKWFIK